MLQLTVITIIISLSLTLLRIYQILPKNRRENKDQQQQQPPAKTPVSTLVVLGSGGHTSEMCTLVQSLDASKYDLQFIIAKSDTKSLAMAQSKLGNTAFLQSTRQQQQQQFHFIPRSREVHQSYFTSIFTTLYAFAYSIYLTLFVVKPDLILVNGPGTCVPICMSAFIPKFFGIKHIKIIYVESAARVESLSVTGLILYHLVADRFLVQWPQLTQKYPRTEYSGLLS